MTATDIIELEIATRLLEAGDRIEAYGVAVHLLHRVGNQCNDEARLCWDRARELALAAQPLAA